MAYPSKETFLVLLQERDHIEIIEEYLLAGVPFAFADAEVSYNLLLDTLSAKLAVERGSITMVGSGRIGFSLSPDHFGTPFSERSDLDMAVVDAELFDRAWLDMLRLGNKYFSLETRVRDWVKTHKANNVYWGFIQPEKLPGVVQVSATWFASFRSLATVREFSSREITGRLYRTCDHVRVQQLHTLRSLRTAIRAEAENT
jgi:hypothetical protein